MSDKDYSAAPAFNNAATLVRSAHSIAQSLRERAAQGVSSYTLAEMEQMIAETYKRVHSETPPEHLIILEAIKNGTLQLDEARSIRALNLIEKKLMEQWLQENPESSERDYLEFRQQQFIRQWMENNPGKDEDAYYLQKWMDDHPTITSASYPGTAAMKTLLLGNKYTTKTGPKATIHFHPTIN